MHSLKLQTFFFYLFGHTFWDTIIADVATYAKPHTFPEGIAHVFVNGEWTIKDGAHTGVLAGKVLIPRR